MKIKRSKSTPKPNKPKKHKMRRGGGAAKGSAYERELCKRISFWFSGGETEDLFWRTSGSGSRATNRRRLGQSPSKYDFGDMKHELPEGLPLTEHICWEFRSRARFDAFTTFGTGEEDPKTSLLSSWAKASCEADCSVRYPILITKAVRRPEVIWIPYPLYAEIAVVDDKVRKIPWMRIHIPDGLNVRYEGKKTYTFQEQSVVGLSLVEWFFAMDPEVFLACVRSWLKK